MVLERGDAGGSERRPAGYGPINEMPMNAILANEIDSRNRKAVVASALLVSETGDLYCVVDADPGEPRSAVVERSSVPGRHSIVFETEKGLFSCGPFQEPRGGFMSHSAIGLIVSGVCGYDEIPLRPARVENASGTESDISIRAMRSP
ncbi:MAG: hypothetical protein ING19_20680 [Azospirillum sp.]|nr:hypothetical protein [Azospirillum sp.]